MTKKHFKLIAFILKRIFSELNLSYQDKETIYSYFIKYLQQENERFNATKFYEAVFK